MAMGKNQLSNSIQSYYTKVLNILLLCTNLSSNEKIIFLVIFSLPERFNPSARFLSTKLQLDKNTALKSITNLIKYKLLDEIYGNQGERVALKINPTNLWMLNFYDESDENLGDPDLKNHPEVTENFTHNKDTRFLKIEDYARSYYPRKEGISVGIEKIKSKNFSEQELNDFHTALKIYSEKNNTNATYCFSLSRFADEWRDYKNNLSVASTKKVNWGKA